MDNHFEKEMLGFLDKQIAAKEKELGTLKEANYDLSEEQYESLPEYLNLIKELNELYRLQRVKNEENKSSGVNEVVDSITEVPPKDYENSITVDKKWVNDEIRCAEEFNEALNLMEKKADAFWGLTVSMGDKLSMILDGDEQSKFSIVYAYSLTYREKFKNNYCKKITRLREGLTTYKEELSELKRSNSIGSNLWNVKYKEKLGPKILLVEKGTINLMCLQMSTKATIFEAYFGTIELGKESFLSDKWLKLSKICKVIKNEGEEWKKEYFDRMEKANSLSEYISQRKDFIEAIKEYCDEFDDTMDETFNTVGHKKSVFTGVFKVFTGVFKDGIKKTFKEIIGTITGKNLEEKEDSFGAGFCYPLSSIIHLLEPIIYLSTIWFFSMLFIWGIHFGLDIKILDYFFIKYSVGIFTGLVLFCFAIFPIILLISACYVFIKLVNKRRWATIIGLCVGGNLFYTIIACIYFYFLMFSVFDVHSVIERFL